MSYVSLWLIPTSETRNEPSSIIYSKAGHTKFHLYPKGFSVPQTSFPQDYGSQFPNPWKHRPGRIQFWCIAMRSSQPAVMDEVFVLHILLVPSIPTPQSNDLCLHQVHPSHPYTLKVPQTTAKLACSLNTPNFPTVGHR